MTVYRTLETSAYLFTLLGFVAGGDLFDFILRGSDENDLDCALLTSSQDDIFTTFSDRPWVTADGSGGRLEVVSCMFWQICRAVAACHEIGIFHRDIKPERFLVGDCITNLGAYSSNDSDGKDSTRRVRTINVKLTGFELSTTDVHSIDMDCGSHPYMSYGEPCIVQG